MHLVDENDIQPIESPDALRAYFVGGEKPPERWRFGTEQELIGVCVDPSRLGRAPDYEGPAGIRALLSSLAEKEWTPVIEGRAVIALTRADEQVTIEPGGQLELAARPVFRAQEMRDSLCRFLSELAEPSREFGIAWLRAGFRPFGLLDEVPWMPKGRYAIMREYMPTVGTLGHEMMKRTATVQTNLDYSDVDDAHAKLRASLSVTSLFTALYANSPIVDGRVSGYQSYRGHVWSDTDRARCGYLPFAFADGDIYAAYTEWALDVPMYFVHRGGYLPAGGMTFRRYMAEGFNGHRATMSDWALHLSTLFPETRLKSYIEIRGCDCGSFETALALAPLCRGLFYDDTARAAAEELTAGLTGEERIALGADVARRGLHAQAGTRLVGDLVEEMVAIAVDGLKRTAPEELPFLEPLQRIATTRRTQADEMIDLWREVAGDPAKVIAALAHEGLHGGLEPSNTTICLNG